MCDGVVTVPQEQTPGSHENDQTSVLAIGNALRLHMDRAGCSAHKAPIVTCGASSGNLCSGRTTLCGTFANVWRASSDLRCR